VPRRMLRPWQEPGADPYLFDKDDEHQTTAHKRHITHMMEGDADTAAAVPRTPRRERRASPKPIRPGEGQAARRGPRRRVTAAHDSPELLAAIERSRSKMPKPMTVEEKVQNLGGESGAVHGEAMENAAAVEERAARVPRRRGRKRKDPGPDAGPLVDFDALAKRHRMEEGPTE